MEERLPFDVLVAGHYCHDTLIGKNGEVHRVLGGSAAYGQAVLRAGGARVAVVSKVGPDFLYRSQVFDNPIIVPGGRTTCFVDDYRGAERRSICDPVCEPIWPADLPGPARIGIACSIAGELPEATLARLRELSGVLLGDVQGLMRAIGPHGEVTHQTRFAKSWAAFDYLKASEEEARTLDLAALLMGGTRVIVTRGARGCTLFAAGQEPLHSPAFPAEERDATGAGDCFLAGFALGLLRKLSSERALQIANFCGAQAVAAVGIPRIDEARLSAQLW